MSKTITIGRHTNCDWHISEKFDTVSHNHATLEESPNGHLILFDHSRNGTVVNGQRIKNSCVELTDGDVIRLANVYTLSWQELHKFFPRKKPMTNLPTMKTTGRETELHHAPIEIEKEIFNTLQKKESDSQIERKKVTARWNWGAFLLNGIWSIGHDCWWPFFVTLGIVLLSFIYIGTYPFSLANASVPVLTICGISVYLCIKGNSIAWANGCYDNLEHLKRKEKQWLYAALAVWCIFFLLITFLIFLHFSRQIQL
mgnify:CR=1 FL=1